ncbi:hypothetical protein M146_5331, partial [Bacteroides fragilis str. 1007-1-F 
MSVYNFVDSNIPMKAIEIQKELETYIDPVK